jgi:D-glutamate N-acetyltransferase
VNNIPTALLAEGAFADDGMSKTCYGLLRYSPEAVVAVIDSSHAGEDACSISGLGRGIPVVADLSSAMEYGPRRLVIGVAPAGGALPQAWREQIILALENGLEVVSGLHTILGEDLELVAASTAGCGAITDLRLPPDDLDVGMGLAQKVRAKVVLTMGTDCNAGKMTTSLELVQLARKKGIKAAFCPTGQTGIAITGTGIAIDHVVSDFMAGAAERLVLEASEREEPELIVVEGQGGLAQPSYSGVTLALMHGSLPDAMILCHRATQKVTEHVKLPMPPLDEHVRLCEEAMRLVKPAKVAALALHTRGMPEDEASKAVEDAARLTGLPATDPVRFGTEMLLEALRPFSEKKPLYSESPARE